MQGPQIQQRLVDVPLAAGAGQFRQHRLADLEVKMSVRPQPDEFLGADDLEFDWHCRRIYYFSVRCNPGRHIDAAALP